MQFAMEALSEEFTASTGIKCNVIIGSSGKLTAQILEGAPYDLFFSADLKYPKTLAAAGLAEESPKVYAHGQLILWGPTLDSVPPLDSKAINHIAIPNPEVAPYGKAAMEFLIKEGVLGVVEPKLVYGESVAQTNQFITTGAAIIGFTSLSVVSAGAEDKGSYRLINPEDYMPIQQAFVVLKSRPELSENARRFVEFLDSSQGKEILTKFGYLTDLN